MAPRTKRSLFHHVDSCHDQKRFAVEVGSQHSRQLSAFSAMKCGSGEATRSATLVDEKGASSFLVELLGQAMASIPWIDASVSSFAAGPLGIFSPRSHLLTTPTVTFKCAAKTAWLTSALARIRRMAAGLSFLTGVRQLRSKTLHRLFVDETKAVKITGVFVRFC